MNDDEHEIEVEATGIEVASQPIELYKVLKLANILSGGGEAKQVIADGYVSLNGELETRKRCKVYADDVVYFNEEYFVVICDQAVTDPVESQAKAKPSSKAKKSNKPQKQAKTKTKASDFSSTTGRRAIKF